MSRIFSAAIVGFLFGLNAHATTVTMSVEEILSMPGANRKMIISGMDRVQLAENLTQTAFAPNRSVPMRWKALTALAEIDPVRAKKELKRAIISPEWFMRNAGLIGYQQLGLAEGHKVGLKLIGDRALVVRSAAVEALKTDLSDAERKILWNELNQEYNFRKKQSLWIRSEILLRLAMAPQKHEYKQFVAGLKDSDLRMHVPSMIALEKLSPKNIFHKKESKIDDARKKWLALISSNPKS